MNRIQQHFSTACALFFLTGLTLLLSCLGVFSTTFFRDYVIAFEGGYRVYLGQMPYRDFFIPMGPLTFYMQAFFYKLFGVNLLASALHSGFLAAVLACSFYLITVKRLGALFSFLLGVLTYFSFTGYLTYPWYNTTAYFFFLMNILLLLPRLDQERLEWKYFILSAVLAVLGIFTKQDTGFLHFVGLLLFFTWHYRQDSKKTGIAYLGLAVLLTAGIIWFYQSHSNFWYWFDHGQRKDKQLLQVLTDGHFFSQGLFFCLIYLAALQFVKVIPKRARRIFFLLALLFGIPSITQLTSGCPWQTKLEGVPIILYLVYELLAPLFANQNRSKFFLKLLKPSLIVLAVLWLNPFFLMGRYFTGSFLTHSAFDHDDWAQDMKAKYGLSGFVPIEAGSYKNCLIKMKHIDGLRQIKKIHNFFPGNIFNMSEYAFLYADFGLEPPKGLPLWFHQGFSYSTQEIPLIETHVAKARPAMIIFQDPHTNKIRVLDMYYWHRFLKQGYVPLFKTAAPAQWKIFVFHNQRELGI